MKTTCPHCQVEIEIDPASHAAFAGHPHFDCPACQEAVPMPVPVRLQLNPAAAIRTAAAVLPAHPTRGALSPSRKIDCKLLILGSAGLLVLGGLGFLLASRSGNIFNTEQKLTNEIIHNHYFHDLISSGKANSKALADIALIRPYRDGYIGISGDNLPWDRSTEMAKEVGASVLAPGLADARARNELARWLGQTFPNHLTAPVWVQEGGQARILDGAEMLAVNSLDRPRKVLLWWAGNGKDPDNIDSAAARRGSNPGPSTNTGLPGGSLQRGLILYFGCDEESPPLAAQDGSGNNNHGKPSGVRWTPEGKRGGAYEFNNDGDQIVVPNNPSLNPAELTLAAWIKTSVADGRWSRIFDKSFDQGYALSVAGDWKGDTYRRGLICFESGSRLKPAPGATYIETKTKVLDGQWHLVVATYDGTEKRMFIDGRLDGNSFRLPQSEPMMSNDFDLVVGCNRSTPPNEAGMSFRGIIDEAMIWNRALSPEEVRLLFEFFQ